jgi:thioesterase domain-containing protein
MSEMTELLQFLHEQIPLTKTMGLSIISIDHTGARIKAPLAPNHNHLGSAFGGSLSTMMILSGYILVYHSLLQRKLSGHVILSREESKYLLPVTTEIEVFAKAPTEEEWKKFEEGITRKGIARIQIRSEINQGNSLAAEFTGEFVAKIA